MKHKRKKKSFFLHRLISKHHPLLFRRLAVLWVFLIILEIGCPLLECRSLAAELPIDYSTTTSTVVLTDAAEPSKILSEVKLKSQDNSITAENPAVTDYQLQKEHCNDECLCHITPLTDLAFIMPKHFQRSSVSPIKLKFQPSSDLLPPYQPPQFS